MPGPSYTRNERPRGIDLLSVVSKAPKGSLDSKKSNLKETDRQFSSGSTNSYLFQLYKKLSDQSMGYDERAQTVVEVKQRLDDYDVEFIPAVWYSAHDLTMGNVPQATRRVALELLFECIKLCKDVSLRKVFLYIVLDGLTTTFDDEKYSHSDPNIGLLLQCLRECLADIQTLLDPNEVNLLIATLEENIRQEVQNKKSRSTSAIMELLALVTSLKAPMQDESLLELIELSSSITDVSQKNTPKLQLRILSYVTYFVREHQILASPQILYQVATILNKVSLQSNDPESTAELNSLLHYIAYSALSSDFLEQLFKMALMENANCDKILEAYSSTLVTQLVSYDENDQSEPEKQTILMINRLHYMKKSRILLSVTEELLRLFLTGNGANDDKSGTLTRVSAQTGLWPLIKWLLARNDESSRRSALINVFLSTSIECGALIPIPLDDLIRFICNLELPFDCELILKLVDVRRAEIYDVQTLDALCGYVLSSDVPLVCQQEYFNLMIMLTSDATFRPFLLSENQMRAITSLYIKSKSADLKEEALPLFGKMLYHYLQILPIEAFRCFVNSHILPHVKSILAKTKRRKSIVNTIGSFGRVKPPSKENLNRIDILVECLAKAFMWSAFDVSGEKCAVLFDTLILTYEVAESCRHSTTLLSIARVMVRIRDFNGNLYFADPKDAVGISSALGRLKEHLRSENDDIKWTFPEKVNVIDESLLEKRSTNVHFTNNDDGDVKGCINMAKWLSLAIDTIKSPVDWEIYSYLLTHLCSQLSETSLFSSHFDLIDKFKGVVCDHLTRAIPSTIEIGEGISRSDLHSAYVRNLSSVLAYHPYEPKSFADEVVNSLVIGLRSWEKTLIPILHILTVSCFEVPMSVQRYLTPILLQIQKRITNSYAIPSILEFLIALGSSPRSTSNLTIEEVKRVFAIVFRLIENSIDLKLRSQLHPQAEEMTETKRTTSYNQEYEVEISPSTEAFLVGESMIDFFQYQSFKVLSCWFLCLKDDRKKELAPFIMDHLKKLQAVEGLKYDALAQMDFVERCQFFRQRGLVFNNDEDGISEGDSYTNVVSWIHETTLISIRSNLTKRKAMVLVRKPSCTLKFGLEPSVNLSQPATYDIFNFDEGDKSLIGDEELEIQKALRPEAILLQLAYVLGIVSSEHTSIMKIPDDIAFGRSISTLDRIPDKEFQKVGIIYIQKNQDTEAQVLRNTEGSYQYNWFLNEMGKFIKLRDRSKLFYVGGLEEGIDGEYALIWSDEITQIAFHTVTMMPNDKELSSKKRHVGNNFVNIFYDESGLPNFNFNIIKSQFTFISIVITPQTTCERGKNISEHYKVKLYRRTGTPGLLSCAHFKIIRKSNLARYVRHVSQIANVLAQKSHENHSPDVCSIWGIRYKHLNTIRERVEASGNN